MSIHGVKTYYTFGAETTWGTRPATPVYYQIPLESYGVKMARERRNATPMIGLQQRKHGKSFRGMPSGQLVTNLYGYKPDSNAQSIMQYLLTWALSEPETVNKLSKFIDCAEGPDVTNYTHLGLRVNGWTIEGSADSGTVKVTLDLMGKTEASLVTAQTLPNDRELCVEMEFTDCTFAIAGGAVLLRSFRWQGQNGLAPVYLNATSPSHLSAGQLVETLNFVYIKAADTYSAYNRAFTEQEMTGQIVLKGLHNGTGSTGTFTVLTVDFNRMSFVQPEDSSGPALIEQGLTWDILKPDSATAAKTLTYSEA
jgi:hypothetical protein